jgi:hypothetical protein
VRQRYRLFTPGWYVCVLARVQRLPVGGPARRHDNYGRKKQCEVRDEVLHGPPNFVLDVLTPIPTRTTCVAETVHGVRNTSPP